VNVAAAIAGNTVRHAKAERVTSDENHLRPAKQNPSLFIFNELRSMKSHCRNEPFRFEHHLLLKQLTEVAHEQQPALKFHRQIFVNLNE